MVAVFVAPARTALDHLAALSRRLPGWTGLLLLVLGAWAVRFGLFVSLEP